MFNRTISKHPLRRWAALAVVAALAFTPTLAAAATCDDLRESRSQIQGQLVDLVARYPGTHFVIVMCAATASNTYDQTKDSDQATSTFVTCAAIGCALAGFQNCVDVTTQWFKMGLQISQIEDQMRELPDCRP